MVALTFPDGARRDYPDGVTGLEVAKAISPSLAKRTVAMALDGTLADLADPIGRDAGIEFVNRDDPRALELIRHDAAHVLAEAVQTLWPGTQVTIGPVIENGFYYDFFRNEPFTPEDFPAIEKKMREIIARDRPFTKEVWSRDEARRVFRDKGEMFKVELVDAIPADQKINIYKQGDWFDLCRGPHMTSTAKVGNAFKLMKVAGAYWRGDSKNPMLTRIYGTAWNKQEELDAYLKQIEEAEKRDHRRLGREMDLFHFQEEAPGSVFWHAKGWTLFQALENYIRRRQGAAGYAEVNAPQLMDSSLWVASGHMATFRENMFLTQPREDDERVFVVKPMNCPGHIQIFKHGLKSYRDLPYKLGEFGKVHRFEPSGALHGLMRVRAFTQDDAHVFITEEQIAAEALAMNDLILSIYRDFGFSDVAIKFSDRPDKRIGDDAVWDKAEAALMATLKASGRPWTLNKGEGAFYGPKLEYVLRDAIGRDWQCGTIQVDLNMPGRLGAFYIDEHSNKVTPVMLHRAMFGSLERFTGILIEHYAGHFPLWLAPTQAVIATIVSDADGYAREAADLARRAGLRVETDLRNEKINYKVREHSLAKVPTLLVVGKKEAETRTVSIRRLGAQEQTVVGLDEALAGLAAEAVAPDVRRESQYGSQVLLGARDQKVVPLDQTLAEPVPPEVAVTPPSRPVSKEEIERLLQRHEAAEKIRQNQQGLGRPVVSLRAFDRQMVAVGDTIYHSTNWKTFPDFLVDYVKAVLDPAWCGAEMAKPLTERHPIMRWGEALTDYQKVTIKERGKVASAPMTGVVACFLGMAYDLYLLKHNVELQTRLVKRLKDPTQFQGAYYELIVANTLIRAGFDLTLEDETDGESKHCEFSAVSKRTGKRYWVEAKMRAVSGLLGRTDKDGTSDTNPLSSMVPHLNAAFKKPAKNHRLIFIDLNSEPGTIKDGKPEWGERAIKRLERYEQKELAKDQAAYVFVTNLPFHRMLNDPLSNNPLSISALPFGVGIQDFNRPGNYRLSEAHRLKQKHIDAYDIGEALQKYPQLPSTFDGSLPSEAFHGDKGRMLIGETYFFDDIDGKGLLATVTSAAVVESEKKMYIGTDKGSMLSFPMSGEMLADYKANPESYFGKVQPAANSKVNNIFELFEWLMKAHQQLGRDVLLQRLAGVPGIDNMTDDELRAIYCEGVAGAFQKSIDATKNPAPVAAAPKSPDHALGDP